MSGKLFTDALSDETIINLTDEMIREEKRDKNKSGKKLTSSLLKIIPAVAAVALIIGLINIFAGLYNDEIIFQGAVGTSGEEYGESDEFEEFVELGTYVTGEYFSIDYATVSLRPDNEFTFMMSPLSSYFAMGTYRIENGYLILRDDNGLNNNPEEYIFEIKDGRLIYLRGATSAERWVEKGTVFTWQADDVDKNGNINFNITIMPQQYNENPFSNTPYKGETVNKIIYDAAEFESMLSDEYYAITATDGTGQESMYLRSLTYFYNDEYFKDNALVAVTFEGSIPTNINNLERNGNSLSVWARNFEDMNLPENEKFTSGLYTTRVFLLEVKKSDIEGITEVYPGYDYAPVVVIVDETNDDEISDFYIVSEFLDSRVEVPANWWDKYYIVDLSDGFAVYHKATYDINRDMGLLCKVRRGDGTVPDEWIAENPGGASYLSGDGYYIAFSVPTDVQYFPGEITGEEYLELFSQVNEIQRSIATGMKEKKNDELAPEEIEEYNYYPVFDRIEKIYVGDGYEPEKDTVYMLSDEERSELWRLMRIDEWAIASDLPLEVSGTVFHIIEKANQIDESTQAWAFKRYGEQLLIVPSLPDENSVKICYFAPYDILTEIISFIETLTPFSGE